MTTGAEAVARINKSIKMMEKATGDAELFEAWKLNNILGGDRLVMVALDRFDAIFHRLYMKFAGAA